MIEYKWENGEWVEMTATEIKEYNSKYNIATYPHIHYLRLEEGDVLLKMNDADHMKELERIAKEEEKDLLEESREMTCLYLENGFPQKCNHPRVQNDDELFPNRRENLVKYVCLGKPEFCVFKVREEWLKNAK